MIQMPRRSVTRFFIPLIDVLTLLFCIFLLMPLVKAPAEEGGDEPPLSPEEEIEKLKKELEQLRREPGEAVAKMRADLERLRQENMQVLQERMAVRVLEIDAATGRLYYHDPDRAEVRNEADARELIERDRKALAGGPRELYYLILYPRDPRSPYPLGEQRKRYEKWFQEVAHGWDVPGLGTGKGGAP